MSLSHVSLFDTEVLQREKTPAAKARIRSESGSEDRLVSDYIFIETRL